MATIYANNATLRDNQTPTAKIESNQNFGRIRQSYDKYDFSNGQITSSDDLIMMKILKSAKVYGGHMWATQGSASAGKVTVGWLASDDAVESADANGLLDTQDFGNGDINQLMAEESAIPAGLGKEFAAEVSAYMEVTETSVAADNSLEFVLFYAMD